MSSRNVEGWGGGLKVGLGFAFVLSAFGIVAWLGRPKLTKLTTSGADTSVLDKIERLGRDVKDLKKQMRASPQAASAALTTTVAPEQPPGQDNSAVRVLGSREQREEKVARVAAARARMDAEIEMQARDRSFERAVEEQLHSVYTNVEFLGTSFDSLECRTTICRLKSRHDTRDAMRAFARSVARYSPFDNEVFYTYGEGESPVSTLYFARPGSSLPHDF